MRNLKNIVWKDLLKPRYGVVVSNHKFPCVKKGDFGWTYAPAISLKPFKRSLTVPYREFTYRVGGHGTVTFFASKWVMKRIQGIGSLEKHNLNDPIVVK